MERRAEPEKTLAKESLRPVTCNCAGRERPCDQKEQAHEKGLIAPHGERPRSKIRLACRASIPTLRLKALRRAALTSDARKGRLRFALARPASPFRHRPCDNPSGRSLREGRNCSSRRVSHHFEIGFVLYGRAKARRAPIILFTDQDEGRNRKIGAPAAPGPITDGAGERQGMIGGSVRVGREWPSSPRGRSRAGKPALGRYPATSRGRSMPHRRLCAAQGILTSVKSDKSASSHTP